MSGRLSFGWPALAWGSLVAAAVMLLLGALLPVPMIHPGRLPDMGDESRLIPLLPGARPRVELHADRPGLVGLRLRVATYMRRNNCELVVRLLDGQGGEVASRRLRVDWFPDLGHVDVWLKPWTAGLPAGRYMVEISSRGAGPQNAIGLFPEARSESPAVAPLNLAARPSLLAWLAGRRPDYFRVYLGVMILLAAGGVAVGLAEARLTASRV